MSTGESIILGIESSCDDTAAAVICNGKLLANIIAGQDVHKAWGGVVPELASRAHQQNIVPVVDEALKRSGIEKSQLSAIAFTKGPGLIGSLLVGSSFAKAMALALDIPLIEVDHMQGHVLAHFIDDGGKHPEFPFLCLTVSGGHTQIIKITGHFEMELLGETTDDAAGEAFDKAAKIMRLPYPGGPLIDKFAREGDPKKFKFPHPEVPGYDFSFSGLKTSFLYFINKNIKTDPAFIENNKADICASYQAVIIEVLMKKLEQASYDTGIRQIAIAGGVSANSGLRSALQKSAENLNWEIYIPKMEYCTDNAAMIAIAGYFKFLKSEFSNQNCSPSARLGTFRK
jgi:N6-L-threonylcarbamoyladenine synthase